MHHPYKQKEWNGVALIHCYDPVNIIGTAGQFIYDLNCIRDAGKRNFDVLLFLGYTSSSVWGRWYPGKAAIVYNMDGMEWKRSKYPALVKSFLKYAEKLAVKYSNHLVADSAAVKTYLDKKYHVCSSYIPYGAEIIALEDAVILDRYGLKKTEYYMLMARMEPENNIDMILEGFTRSATVNKIIVTGNTSNSFGKKMLLKYRNDNRICFTGGIFNKEKVSTLRKYCRLYFHGHSVGGTNPSLLEAMADSTIIAAHENEFNRAVLQQDAFYFQSAADVLQLVDTMDYLQGSLAMTANNLKKIQETFNWPAVIDAYETILVNCVHKE